MPQELNSLIIDASGQSTLLGKLLFAVIVFLVAKMLSFVLKRLILKGLKDVPMQAKYKTLQQVLFNALHVALYFIAAMLILDRFGVNTNAILATAGIGGVALGFGAQYIVRDVISGMIILAEDQYQIGEYVTIGAVTGVVEFVGLRLTKLRDFGGELHIIQNGNIQVVTNRSRGPQRAWVEISLPLNTDLKLVGDIVSQVSEQVKGEFPQIVEGPSFFGITQAKEYTMTMVVKAMAEGAKHWEVERELRKRLIQSLSEAGIKLPENYGMRSE